jgi:type IV pilus assembly protein PilB
MIEDVSVVSATFFDALVKRFFKDAKSNAVTTGDVDIGSVTETIQNAYEAEGEKGEISAKDLESEESAPIVQLANRIIEDAYISGASDIHIEPRKRNSASATGSTASARKSSGCPSRSPADWSPA